MLLDNFLLLLKDALSSPVCENFDPGTPFWPVRFLSPHLNFSFLWHQLWAVTCVALLGHLACQ